MPQFTMTDPADPCEVAPDRWMACTERLCLRVLRAEDAALLREITSPPGWVEAVAAQSGDRTLTPWAAILRDGGAVAGFCPGCL